MILSFLNPCFSSFIFYMKAFLVIKASQKSLHCNLRSTLCQTHIHYCLGVSFLDKSLIISILYQFLLTCWFHRVTFSDSVLKNIVFFNYYQGAADSKSKSIFLGMSLFHLISKWLINCMHYLQTFHWSDFIGRRGFWTKWRGRGKRAIEVNIDKEYHL